ncbi:MAG: DUF2089 domain-containing protein [Bacillota bacterium]
MQYQPPSKCPVCAGELRITKLSCPQCKTELSGSFPPCKYCSLDEKQQLFMEAFLKCRGNIREVEKALGISYPTVKGLLEDLLNALFPDETPVKPEAENVSDVLDKLEKKEITAAEAAKILKQLKGE